MSACWPLDRLPLLMRALRMPACTPTFTPAQWDLCLRQALSANLTATLWALLVDAGLLDQVDGAARAHLQWYGRLAQRHSHAVRWEVRQIAAALREGDFPLILLKGAAYVMADLPAARGRLFSDIDILVPQGALPMVESDLLFGGWVASRQDAYDQRYYRQWMHELPPMIHAQRQSMIDVHHAILPPTARVHPDPALLRAAAMAIAGDAAEIADTHAGMLVKTLCPADMLLHSATHLFFDGEFHHGLRDMVDLDRLLRHFGADPAFWHALPARAAELELTLPLFYALRYSRRLLDTPVPQHVLVTVDGLARPGRVRLALMDALFVRTLQPPHASCSDGGTALARFALYVRGNWLRMPPLMLARHLFHKAFISPKSTSAA